MNMERDKGKLKGFKINDEVMTPHGKGRVSKFEEFRMSERIAVELDNNPFTFPIAYYFPYELRHL